jgi:YaiO family outer membrane protein
VRRNRHIRSAVWSIRSCRLLALTVIAAVALNGAAYAQEAPITKYVEGGVDVGYYTNYGWGNAEWAAFILSRSGDFNLRFDLGRSERFYDVGIGGGAILTKYFSNRWQASLGASGGTGKFILPKYRIDLGVGRAFLPDGNLIISVGYTHNQFKAPNYFDRISPSFSWWANDHWIFGGYFNYDIGQPGDTKTLYGGLGATWYTWQERFIGLEFAGGDINYTQVGVTDFLVNYEEYAVRLYYTEYFNETWGMNSRAEYLTNEMFDVYGVSVSLFKVW